MKRQWFACGSTILMLVSLLTAAVSTGRALTAPASAPRACTDVAHVRAPALVLFASTFYRYCIGYPAGWRHQIYPFGTIKVDAFFSPTAVDGFTDNMNIFSAPLPGSITSDSLLRINERQLRQRLKVSLHKVGYVHVAGRRLTLIAYDLRFGGRTISTTQAVLALGGRGWYFSMGARFKDVIALRSVFVKMLGTFKVVSAVVRSIDTGSTVQIGLISPAVASIFQEHCATCHVAAVFGGLSMRNYAALLNGGNLIPGPVIVPGDHKKSMLWQIVQLEVPWPGGQRMPLAGPYLSPADISTIATWIDHLK